MSDGADTADARIALTSGASDAAGVCVFADTDRLMKALRLFAASPSFWTAFNES
jgi:hypothetical protein